jgi:hypothetical protein
MLKGITWKEEHTIGVILWASGSLGVAISMSGPRWSLIGYAVSALFVSAAMGVLLLSDSIRTKTNSEEAKKSTSSNVFSPPVRKSYVPAPEVRTRPSPRPPSNLPTGYVHRVDATGSSAQEALSQGGPIPTRLRHPPDPQAAVAPKPGPGPGPIPNRLLKREG